MISPELFINMRIHTIAVGNEVKHRSLAGYLGVVVALKYKGLAAQVLWDGTHIRTWVYSDNLVAVRRKRG
tara:strand:+ start:1114 stop:1323 length:210 start_codon:yes stop_codon:yes gene_type:complete